MRPVVWISGQGAPAFCLAPGSLVEVTDAEPANAAAIAAGLAAEGFRVRTTPLPSGSADAVVFTEGLTTDTPEVRHWAALGGANAARRSGSVLVFLQNSGTLTGLEGLSRTLRKEWPEVQAFAWTTPEGATHLVIRALLEGYPDGIIDQTGAHYVPYADEYVKPAAELDEKGYGVWLVTGGARGVTAACAIELARRAGGTILLAGRSAETPWPEGLPVTDDLKTLRGLLVGRSREKGERLSPAEIDRTARNLLAGSEIRETLSAIRATGATAEYIPLDAGDVASVAQVLGKAQSRWGAITGWVHGAGVLADKLAADKTEAELRRVFAPKVGGLINILGALDLPSLRHIGFFSSAAAFFGNKGQSDYAMANSILADAGRSLSVRLPDSRVKVFHWGPWAGGMVDGTLASHFEAQGIPLIPIDEGARIFATELLNGSRDQVELVVGEAWAAA